MRAISYFILLWSHYFLSAVWIVYTKEWPSYREVLYGLVMGSFNYLSTMFLLKSVLRLPAFLCVSGVQCRRDLICKCCKFPVFERKTAKERLCCNGVYQRSACADGRKLVRRRFTIRCTGVQIKFLQVFHLRTFCSIIKISFMNETGM